MSPNTEVTALLEQILAPAASDIRSASTRLEKEWYQNPSSVLILINIALNDQRREIRQLAAVEARKLVAKHWKESFKTDQQNTLAVRDALLQSCFTETDPLVKHSLARVVGAIVSQNLSDWPEISTSLLTLEPSSVTELETKIYLIYTIASASPTYLTENIDTLLPIFDQALSVPNAQTVHFNALLGLTEVAQIIDEVGVKKYAPAFRAIFPRTLAVFKEVLDSGDDENASEVYTFFNELLYAHSSLLGSHIGDLFQAMIQVASSNTLNPALRCPAIQFFMVCTATKKSKIQKHKLGPVLASMALSIMSETSEFDDDEDDSPSDIEDDDDYQDSEDPRSVALDLIRTLCVYLPASQVSAAIVDAIPQYIQSTDVNHRRAILQAVDAAVEGTPDYFGDKLDSLFLLLEHGFRDSSAKVRIAALNALHQIALECPEVVSAHHETLVPMIFNVLSGNDVNFSKAAIRALDAVLDVMTQDEITRYVNSVMDFLLQFVKHSDNKVLKSKVIRSIGSTAHSAKSAFKPYATPTMQLLETCLGSPVETDDDQQILCRVFETLGEVALAIGKEDFAFFATPSLEISMKALEASAKDPSSSVPDSVYAFWVSMAELYRKDFAPFLDTVFQTLFPRLEVEENNSLLDILESQLYDDDDLDSELVQQMAQDSALSSEKSIVAQTLADILSACQEACAPYVSKIITIVTPLAGSMHESVRVGALGCLWQSITILCKVQDPDMKKLDVNAPFPYTDLKALCEPLVSITVKILQEDDDLTVVGTCCTALALFVKECGPGLVMDSVEPISECLFSILSKKHISQLIFEGQYLDDDNEEFEDLDDEEDKEDGADEDMSEWQRGLIESALDLVEAFCKVFGASYLRFFEMYLPHIVSLARSPSPAERAYAIGVLAECAGALGGSADFKKHVQTLFNLMYESLADSGEEVRSHSAYGIGIMVITVPDLIEDIKPMYPSILSQLQQIIASGYRAPRTLANVCGCVGRMILRSPDAMPMVESVVSSVLSYMPLKDGFEEYSPVLDMLVLLYPSHKALIDQNGVVVYNIAIDAINHSPDTAEYDVLTPGSKRFEDVKNLLVSITQANKDTEELLQQFLSFKDRIDKISVTAVRRSAVPQDTDTSYFVDAYHKWVELTLATDFVQFSRQIRSYSQSLPLVLYHKDTIFSKLEEYIAHEDVHSLEALLDLLTQFCRDLGPDFEPYFTRSFKLLANLSHNSDPNVVNCTFTAMAFIFKYLSKLLVPDLVPTYDLVAPLLGKERQRPYISKFAAEAFSYLLRRVPETDLPRLIEHVLTDVKESDTPEYTAGCASVFVESVKNVKMTLHSRAPLILQNLLHSQTKYLPLLSKVIIQTLHHVNSQTSEPLESTVLEYLKTANDLEISSCLLFCLIGTRKGSRVTQWDEVSLVLESLTSETKVSPENTQLLLCCVSAYFQGCPLSFVLKHSQTIISGFISNCGYLPFLQLVSFLINARKDIISGVCIKPLVSLLKTDGILPALYTLTDLSDAFRDSSLDDSALKIPSSLQISVFEQLEDNAQAIAAMTFVQLNCCTSEVSDYISRRLSSIDVQSQTDLYTAFLLYCTADSSWCKDHTETVIGCIQYRGDSDIKYSDVAYLLVLLKFIKNNNEWKPSDTEFHNLTRFLLKYLKFHSHEVRRNALSCYMSLFERKTTVTDTVSVCALIEEISVTAENARSLSLQVKRLSNVALRGTDLEKDIFVSYCFGLLTVQFTPLWQDVYQALALNSKIESVWSYSLDLLRSSSTKNEPDFEYVEYPLNIDEIISPDCTNVEWICQKSQASFQALNLSSAEISKTMMLKFLKEDRTSKNTMEQGLELLKHIPALAEKHSSDIVPLFIDVFNATDFDAEDEEKPERLSYTAQIKLLDLFGKFKNPKSLYSSERVRGLLFNLLSRGDQSIQERAFKALLTWKDPALIRYSENILKLITDTNFRDEATTFLLPAGEESAIQENYRADVLDVVLPILYGRSLAKKSRVDNRHAVLTVLANTGMDAVEQFCDLATSFSHYKHFVNTSLSPYTFDLSIAKFESAADFRRAKGYCSMLNDIIEHFGYSLAPIGHKLLEPLLFFLVANESAVEDSNHLSKAMRRSAFLCLYDFYSHVYGFEWTNWQPAIMHDIFEPRMDNFASENLEVPSILMKLFLLWASKPEYVEFLAYNKHLVPSRLIGCFENDNVKTPVVEYVVDFVNSLLSFALDDNETAISLVSKIVQRYLQRLTVLISRCTSPQLLTKEIDSVISLAELNLFTDSEVAHELITTLFATLDKPAFPLRVASRVSLYKAILKVIEKQSSFKTGGFDLVLAKQFHFAKDRDSRVILSAILQSIALKNDAYSTAGALVTDLNAYSSSRLDDPDFGARLDAYAKINESVSEQLSALTWLYIVSNSLFFVQDPEELSLRTSAGLSIKRFLQMLAREDSSDIDNNISMSLIYTDILLPSVRYGLKEESEVLRSEWIRILADCVEILKDKSEMADLQVLLFDGDMEANIFVNLLHIQQHRKLRAIRRIGSMAKKGLFSSSSISQCLLPIVEHYIPSSDQEGTELGEETIRVIGALCSQLTWKQYRAIFKRYAKSLSSTAKVFRVTTRLLTAATSALSLRDEPDPETTKPKLLETLPDQNELRKTILEDFCPKLQNAMHIKNADEESLYYRIPLVIPIVRLYLLLDYDDIAVRLPGTLTNLCQKLRSREEEVRRNVRSTLTRVCKLLKKEHYPFVFRELKDALTRGYQVHILGYTVHYLLVELQGHFQVGDLDPSAPILMDIIMEEIFGAVAEEKEAEDYISRMKEINTQKSYDSARLLAMFVSIPQFAAIVTPISNFLLYEKLSSKTEKKLSELLRRISLGIAENTESNSKSTLQLCYELFQESVPAASKPEISNTPARDESHFIVHNNSRNNGIKEYPENKSILANLSFDILSSVLSRSKALFDLASVRQFVPMLIKSFDNPRESVRASGMRLLSSIIDLSGGELDEWNTQIAMNCMTIIKETADTSDQLFHSALKLSSTLLNSSAKHGFDDEDIGYILNFIKDDLLEPDRQGAFFTFLRAATNRHILIAEVYDIFDIVRDMMVTSHSKTTRESARTLYFKFLLEYPHGKKRFAAQYSFLIKNLEYPYESGRLAVLEVINSLLIRVKDETFEEFLGPLYGALVLVIVNDNSLICRQFAIMCLTKLIQRMSSENLAGIVNTAIGWLKQSDNLKLVRGGLDVILVYLSCTTPSEKEFWLVCLDSLENVLSTEEESAAQWEVQLSAIALLDKITEIDTAKEYTAQSQAALWDKLERLLLQRNVQVQIESSKLLQKVLLADSVENNYIFVEDELKSRYVEAIFEQLKSSNLSPELAEACTRNMLLLVNGFKGLADADGYESFLNACRRCTNAERTRRGISLFESRKAICRIVAGFIELKDVETVKTESVDIVRAVLPLTNNDTEEVNEEIKNLSEEVLQKLAKTIGETNYAQSVGTVREEMKARRIERKHKRSIMAVAHPDKAASKRLKKNVKQKSVRKENASPSDSTGGSNVRRRAAKACIACRKRKIKCDVLKHYPCSKCNSLGTPCTLVESKRGRKKGTIIKRKPKIGSDGSNSIDTLAAVAATMSPSLPASPNTPESHPASSAYGSTDRASSQTSIRDLTSDTFSQRSPVSVAYPRHFSESGKSKQTDSSMIESPLPSSGDSLQRVGSSSQDTTFTLSHLLNSISEQEQKEKNDMTLSNASRTDYLATLLRIINNLSNESLRTADLDSNLYYSEFSVYHFFRKSLEEKANSLEKERSGEGSITSRLNSEFNESSSLPSSSRQPQGIVNTAHTGQAIDTVSQSLPAADPMSNYTISKDIDSLTLQYLKQKKVFVVPPRRICVQMLKLFFRFVDPCVPVIHLGQFTHDLWGGTLSPLLLHSMLYISSFFASNDILEALNYKSRSEAAEAFFANAKLIEALDLEKSKLCRIQAYTIMAFNPGVTGDDKNSRYWIGRALRLAQHLGMNRRSQHQKLDPDNRKLWLRIWSVLYARDRYISISTGSNMAVNDNNVDITDTLDESHFIDSNPEPIPFGFPTHRSDYSVMFSLNYIKMGNICGAIALCNYAARAHGTETERRKCAQLLEEYDRNLPNCLRVISNEKNSIDLDTHIFQRSIQIGYLLGVILLHRPGYENNEPQSRKIVVDAAYNLIKHVEFLTKSNIAVHTAMIFLSSLFLAVVVALNEAFNNPEDLSARRQLIMGLDILREMASAWHQAGMLYTMTRLAIKKLQLVPGSTFKETVIVRDADEVSEFTDSASLSQRGNSNENRDQSGVRVGTSSGSIARSAVASSEDTEAFQTDVIPTSIASLPLRLQFKYAGPFGLPAGGFNDNMFSAENMDDMTGFGKFDIDSTDLDKFMGTSDAMDELFDKEGPYSSYDILGNTQAWGYLHKSTLKTLFEPDL
ncbi:hypothetical protein CANCADRAFT_4376 [Tortispora caseinolytica NRRL Y-17796]|uniref:Importin N-terminal domain-containing protein n=1 Tax=Tortispora caseinolytica NRRL Y-17796 TaxID=767744 RepID=A0A1E4TDB6_9ASCO|nr:hypothetical protein CANCADRAFT_4376 [Tortispora caseinolytica NRRL Y-17796]